MQWVATDGTLFVNVYMTATITVETCFTLRNSLPVVLILLDGMNNCIQNTFLRGRQLTEIAQPRSRFDGCNHRGLWSG